MMGKLNRRFENLISEIGFMQMELLAAVFYSVPIGIHIKLGIKRRHVF